MKKALALSLAASLFVAAPAAAADPLAATIIKLTQTAYTVTVAAEQTAGASTRLYVEHDCYAGSLFIPSKVSFTGAGTFTFATSGRYHGQDWVADYCGAYVYLNLGSNAIDVLAQVTTVP